MKLAQVVIKRILVMLLILSITAEILAARTPKEPEIGTFAVDGTFDAPPMLKFRPKFEYPPVLADKKVEGDAEVMFSVDESGHVTEVKVLSAPHPYAGSCVMSTVARMVFSPAKLRGKAVGFQARVRVTYSLK